MRLQKHTPTWKRVRPSQKSQIPLLEYDQGPWNVKSHFELQRIHINLNETNKQINKQINKTKNKQTNKETKIQWTHIASLPS